MIQLCQMTESKGRDIPSEDVGLETTVRGGPAGALGQPVFSCRFGGGGVQKFEIPQQRCVCHWDYSL